MKNNVEETFLQVWDYLIDNDDFDCKDLILMAKIISLHSTKDGCYASNKTIGGWLRIDEKNASRRLAKLKKLGYINIISWGKNNNTKRVIVPTYDNGLVLKTTRGSVANDKGVLSQTSRGIVAIDKGGLSQTSHNNINLLNNLKEQLNKTSMIISENKFETEEERVVAYAERNRIEKELKKNKISLI